jgi:fumarate hydratase class II
MKPDDGPRILKIPVGINASGTRRENDSMGAVEVPADRYWGAQTARSLIHFSIGNDHMPTEVYHAYGYVKKAAAAVNADAGRLPRWKADLICHVCEEVIAGHLDEHFPRPFGAPLAAIDFPVGGQIIPRRVAGWRGWCAIRLARHETQ